MVLANYIKSFPVDAQTGLPTITADSGYADVTGSGRITVITDHNDAVEAYDLWVAGMQVTEGNARDVFGDGKVSYDPDADILTLNGYTYEGDGYIYGESTDDPADLETYAAAIYSKDHITIRLEGNSTLKNSFNIPDKGKYGDGVVAAGSITVKGSGSLHISGSYGIEAAENLTIDGCTIKLETADDALSTIDGSVTIENGANVMIDAQGDGIFAVSGLTVIGSCMEIHAQDDGIYVYDGSVSITDSSADISAGEDDLAFKVDIGELILNGHLIISVPDGGYVKSFTDTYEGEAYTYDTIVDQSGNEAAHVTIEKAPCAGFTDINENTWYHEAVDYVIGNGLMNGIGGGKFNPDGTTSRAMIATILWRLEGEPICGQGKSGTFVDVPEYQWYTEAIEWAASKGVVEGWNGKFDPMSEVTREQLATILYRYVQFKGGGFTGAWMFLLDYADRENISEYAYEALCWMTMNGIMEGRGERILDPTGNATRCEAAVVLMRFSELNK